MSKTRHEVRDPIHVFIHYDEDERAVLNSRPFQRLRHIHQLAMSYLVYPGATHKRFEHSLGVMELASRVFDVVTHHDAIIDEIRILLPEFESEDKRNYWRRVLRMAALCHDLGHLPFSHAAEEALLPEGWNHERLTKEIILSPGMREIWQQMTPPLRPNDIVKLALGKRKAPEIHFTTGETLLAEIIVGDAFGVDRMDYLLRDSHHAGVAYGRFDHYRLIDSLRILRQPAAEQGEKPDEEEPIPALGIEEGGVQSAEGLLLARYFMFSQVYFHPVRRIYDIHLKEFLMAWLENGRFSVDVDKLLRVTDNEVTAAFREAAFDSSLPGHDPAHRIVLRGHYKLSYSPDPEELGINIQAGRAIAMAASAKYGTDKVRYDYVQPKGAVVDFPVRTRNNHIVPALAISQAIGVIPPAKADYVFIEPTLRDRAERWIKNNCRSIITPKKEEDGHGTTA